MTIIFHTKYPNTSATLTFLGQTLTLVTDDQGNLYWLEVADGKYPYVIVINSQTYSGTITIINNNGYVDVTGGAPYNLISIAGMLGTGVAFILLTKKMM